MAVTNTRFTYNQHTCVNAVRLKIQSLQQVNDHIKGLINNTTKQENDTARLLNSTF